MRRTASIRIRVENIQYSNAVGPSLHCLYCQKAYGCVGWTTAPQPALLGSELLEPTGRHRVVTLGSLAESILLKGTTSKNMHGMETCQRDKKVSVTHTSVGVQLNPGGLPTAEQGVEATPP